MSQDRVAYDKNKFKFMYDIVWKLANKPINEKNENPVRKIAKNEPRFC